MLRYSAAMTALSGAQWPMAVQLLHEIGKARYIDWFRKNTYRTSIIHIYVLYILAVTGSQKLSSASVFSLWVLVYILFELFVNVFLVSFCFFSVGTDLIPGG